MSKKPKHHPLPPELAKGIAEELYNAGIVLTLMIEEGGQLHMFVFDHEGHRIQIAQVLRQIADKYEANEISHFDLKEDMP